MNNKSLFLLIVTCILGNACNSQQLELSISTDFGNFKYSIQDTLVVKDLIKICDSKLNEISGILHLELNYVPVIEIYPDQAEYDKHIMNEKLRGSPAISGNGRIQMVSPLGKIKIDSISYPDRLLFLVHEYVHLLIDEVDSQPPVFLDEGLACYCGSHNFYNYIITYHANQISFVPTLGQLIDQYDEIPAADVYSFLFIDYLMKTGNKDTISALIQNPVDILSYNQAWIEYMKGKFQ